MTVCVVPFLFYCLPTYLPSGGISLYHYTLCLQPTDFCHRFWYCHYPTSFPLCPTAAFCLPAYARPVTVTVTTVADTGEMPAHSVHAARCRSPFCRSIPHAIVMLPVAAHTIYTTAFYVSRFAMPACLHCDHRVYAAAAL